ncbi:MAG: hypothetical protein RR436_06155 [Clostridia bacterium]
MIILNEDFKISLENKKNFLKMIKGYKKMARINIELANEFISIDSQALKKYELYLAESENCDSKARRNILC